MVNRHDVQFTADSEIVLIWATDINAEFQRVLYPYTSKLTDEVPEELGLTFSAVMYAWDTNALIQLVGDDSEDEEVTGAIETWMITNMEPAKKVNPDDVSEVLRELATTYAPHITVNGFKLV